jgi:hypothetical protein
MKRVTDAAVLSSSDVACYSQLASLTIKECQLEIVELQLILSITPALVHLKLISRRSTFDSWFNGSCWEELIQTKLPLLNKFDFYVCRTSDNNQNIDDVNTVIAPFRTLFWLDNKRWFVTCIHIIRSSMIWLSTTPVDVTNFKYSTRYEVSSKDGACRLVLDLVRFFYEMLLSFSNQNFVMIILLTIQF